MAEALLASIDGHRVDPGEARIPILDDGLLRGDGAFEAIKLYGGHPFRLEEHIDRLGRSAASIDLQVDLGAVREEVAALLDGFGEEATLRIVVTRGGRRILLVERIPEWAPSARIALIELTPNEILRGVKSISYAANMHAGRLAARRGADEAVFVRPDGIVLEAPTSSVFWVDGKGSVRTPALELGILDSITRRVVIDALEVEQGAFEAGGLASAGEAFLASTTREVQPISAVDGAGLAQPEGGAAAEAAAEALAAAVERERRSE